MCWRICEAPDFTDIQAAIHPLPEREGRGEGKGRANFEAWTNFKRGAYHLDFLPNSCKLFTEYPFFFSAAMPSAAALAPLRVVMIGVLV